MRLGVLSERQKRDFFAGIDVFALPSRSDSFGLVLLEAWANGVPERRLSRRRHRRRDPPRPRWPAGSVRGYRRSWRRRCDSSVSMFRSESAWAGQDTTGCGRISPGRRNWSWFVQWLEGWRKKFGPTRPPRTLPTSRTRNRSEFRSRTPNVSADVAPLHYSKVRNKRRGILAFLQENLSAVTSVSAHERRGRTRFAHGGMKDPREMPPSGDGGFGYASGASCGPPCGGRCLDVDYPCPAPQWPQCPSMKPTFYDVASKAATPQLG